MARDFTYDPPASEQTALVRGTDAAAPKGELVTMPRVEPVSLRDVTFAKSGTQRLAKTAERILRKPFTEKKQVEILPTGEVYVSHVFYRRRLNDAVGPMGWALRPVSEIDTRSAENQMFREYALIVLGRVVATAYGSAKYYPGSARMDFADTAEAVKSNALTRCCKDLGIAAECWEREWCDDWREKYCVHVWVIEKVRKKENGHWVEKKETNARWRKVSHKPLPGEIDIVHDSPNHAAWRKQFNEYAAKLEAETKASRVVADRLQKARKDLIAAKQDAKAAEAAPQPPAQGGESRQQTPPPPDVKSEPAKTPEVVNEGAPPKPSAPVQHTNGDAKDRPFLIRNCQIVDDAPDYKLHKITMLDGMEYFTFSTRVYGEMQKYWAARTPIKIFAQNQKARGREYPHIVEWTETKTGAKKK